MGGPRVFRIKLQAPYKIWTGDHKRSNVLRESGLIGSIRWWYEALIRALGGTACGPIDNSKCNGRIHCDACELFGCRGWSRKFILRCSNGKTIKISITELRKMKDVELGLLNTTFRIIENYGAMGGKLAHEEYGIIRIMESDLEEFQPEKSQLKGYLRKKGSHCKNPNLKRFIFIENPDRRLVMKLKDECDFLKGSNNRGKRYFYKTSGKRLFAYALNEDEYSRIIQCAPGDRVTTWDEFLEELL
ncbi:type III-B CRISPR module RAMP protein Cmr1 [Methanothermobacter sp.]|uniref:type III-B CRISPR module RAMP protein Cmr1 n=1 Tax=Methanothermobacter sp. TaxID=1884223 RepID=UPI002630EF22|nr:type III-B CRISPR module RAMP protein Cmr1 [Methanothermobacter sp.]MDI9615092.1 type III-B CRISPR module RAMP protein Cmr1 [Methanothermobacter sp.]